MGLSLFCFSEYLYKKNGTSSQDGFEEWNLTADSAARFLQQEPKFFKTLNLMNLIKMFNDVANEEFKPSLIASIKLDFDLEKK